MLFLLLPIIVTSQMQLNSIPSTYSPPNSLLRFSAVYDESQNQIITIGGSDPKTFKNLDWIITFNLTTLKYKTITQISMSNFEEMSGNQLFARKDGIIINFGYSPGCSSFNPQNYEWRNIDLLGDPFPPIVDFSSVLYERGGVQYVAIFGGINTFSLSNDLYM